MNAHSPRRMAPELAAALAADAAFAARAMPLLEAREAAMFHCDALAGIDATSPRMGDTITRQARHWFGQAITDLDRAIDDVRQTVATETGVPLDSIETTARLIKQHAAGRMPVMVDIFHNAEARN
jgi:hypothetical protein